MNGGFTPGPQLTIRPATALDAPVAAELIDMTMGQLADLLLGSDDPAWVMAVLARLFVRTGNRFSFEFATMAEFRGSAVGLLVAYPGAMLHSFDLPMARQLLAECGPVGKLRFLHYAWPFIGIREAEPDEFFVNDVAVLPAYRGQGIGTRLLAVAEQRARSAGLGKCSLTVDLGNTRAQALYERLGYRIANTIRVKRWSRRLGCEGLYRMVKRLPAP
jgi:ribosomal protein S18 acetylase RimI-like enzyme